MTQGDKAPPQFVKGQKLKASDLNGLTEAVASVMRKMQGQDVVRPQNISGKLDGELVAASSFGSSPGTATLSVWTKDSSGNMVDSGRNETVTNRFERISLLAGTIVHAEWIDGEWRIYAADCG